MHLGRNLKILLFFSLLYFLTCYAIAHHWYVSGYFSVYDVFFDTDPHKNISVFAHGWERDTLIHPILKLFSIVTRLIEHIISSVFYISEPKVFREKMTLAISPFFSSLSIICFYFLWNILHSEESNTLVFSLIFALIFSNFIFAIIPESYSISCFLITLCLYYYCRNEKQESAGKRIIWLSLAVALAGITITNIFMFFLIYVAHLINTEKITLPRAVQKASLYSLTATILALTVYFVLLQIFTTEVDKTKTIQFITNPDWTSASISTTASNFINLLGTASNSILGIFPITRPNQFCEDIAVTCNQISFIRKTVSAPLMIFATGVLFWAIASSKKHWQSVHFLCLWILGYNLLLHSFFGRESFLYSQHWVTALCLILFAPLTKRRLLSYLLLALVIGAQINFFLSVEDLVAWSQEV